VIRRFDCAIPAERAEGLSLAADAARRGESIVFPTDTVYGVGTDAFVPGASVELLRLKGRGRQMPVAVLVGSLRTMTGLAAGDLEPVTELARAFWPGGLTIVCRAQPSLHWDLGNTDSTVALRMPLHPVALELLADVGPMATSSANRTGSPAAVSAQQAIDAFGEEVFCYLDGGSVGESVASTIVDLSGESPVVLRTGAVSIAQLREVLPELTIPGSAAGES
jgi:L-threonylcarbamoyladenylate synthase